MNAKAFLSFSPVNLSTLGKSLRSRQHTELKTLFVLHRLLKFADIREVVRIIFPLHHS